MFNRLIVYECETILCYCVHPSIHPSIHPPIHPSIHPSIHPYLYSVSTWTVAPRWLLEDVVRAQCVLGSCHQARLWPPSSTPLPSSASTLWPLLRDKQRKVSRPAHKHSVNTFFTRLMEEKVNTLFPLTRSSHTEHTETQKQTCIM